MQGERADRGMLALIAAQPKQFPCSLDPSPTSSSDASAKAGNPASRQLSMLSLMSLHHVHRLHSQLDDCRRLEHLLAQVHLTCWQLA